MAYMSQERKAQLAPAIKAVLKQYGLKGSISVHNHSTLVVTLKSGKIDFIGNMYAIAMQRPDTHYAREQAPKPTHIDVNTYWIADNYTGQARDCLLALKAAMMTGNHDNSDVQTDYFDVGWYIDIDVGKWDKPYVLDNV